MREDKTDNDGIEFFIKGENSTFILIIHGSKKVKEMDEFLEFFTDKGAKLFDKKKLAKGEALYYLATWIMIAIALFYIGRAIINL